MKIGFNQQNQYLNEHGELVKWRFVQVLEIQDLCEKDIFDGTEVYSRIFYRNDA